MNKLYTFLVTVGFLIITLSINAQPTFYFIPSNSAPDLGEQITVDVLVDGFTDITSYQFSVNWNISYLSYVSIGNFNSELGLNAGNFGTTMTGNGKLSTLWSDPLANPQTLANGSVLFTITLDVVATGPVSTDIQFTGDPTPIEVTQDTGGGIMDITDSVIFIDVTLDIGGGGSGGGGQNCNFNGFGLLVESDSVDTGQQVCLDVAACNFTDILSMQYTMQFDPALLQFDSVGNFNLENLSSGNFGTTMVDNGFVTVSWNDPMGQGVSVPDETVIYSICYTAIGAGGSVDSVLINGSLAPIEVTDINSGGNNIGLESIDGEVTITGDSGNAVTVLASCESGQLGDTVYVEVSVRNFIDILGMQYSMAWDPSIIDFYETQWTGALSGSPSFNTDSVLVNDGKLSFLWTDPLAEGVTVSDDTVIYRVGFIIVGSAGESSSVSFTGDPVPIEVTQDNGGNAEVVPLTTVSGKVDVMGEGLFSLMLSNEFACTGDTIEVEVAVENFNDIVSMQYDVQWDNLHLAYIDVTDFNLSGLSAGQFNQINANTLRIVWVEPTITPQTLPDSTIIYKIRFEVLGNDGTISDVVFLDNPPDNPVEISCCSGEVLDFYNLENSKQTVDCGGGSPIVVTDTLITNVLCSGESVGGIDITVTGGNGNYNFEWSNGLPAQEDQSDLAAGDYTVTITSGTETLVETYTVSEATVSTTSTMVSCHDLCDGAIDLIISEYSGNLTYTWNNSLPDQEDQTDLCAGTYFVTITAPSGCTRIEGPIPVTQPSELSVNSDITNETGGNMDGSIDLTVSGGTPNYNYNWSNGDTTQNVSGLAQGSYSVTVTDQNGCQFIETYLVDGSMAVIADVTDVSCFGGNDGAISVTVGGGTAPFNYEWNGSLPGTPNQENLLAGTYNVTVTDANGGMVISSIQVNQPDAITILDANINNETGNGCNGSIDIVVIGGTPPFSYQWSNGAASEDISDLCKGNYNVTIVDANECIFLSSTFTVLPPPLVVANSEQDDVTCNGGDDGGVCITVLGGCGPYTFDIPNSGVNPIINNDGNACFSDLEAGNYNIVIQDSGNPVNVIVHAIEISQPDPIMIGVDNIINNTDPNCDNPNGTINISVSGGILPYSYVWSNGSTDEDPTNLCHSNPFNVTVTDGNGCIQVLSNITLNLGLSVIVDEVNDACFEECDGSISVTVTGGTTPYSYDWDNADPNNLCAGSYGVTVTDATGNTVEVTNIIISQPLSALSVSINTVTNPNGNNSDGSINIDVSGGWGAYTYQWSNGASSQNIAGLPTGSYTVTVSDANGCQAFLTQNLEAVGLTLELLIENPLCHGDSNGLIEVFVQGGSGNYNYAWNYDDNNQTSLAFGLAAGNYSVTVTDNLINGLSGSSMISLTEPGPIVINIIATPSNGGATGILEAQVEGGTAPYTYLWNDDDTQTTSIAELLTAGEYAVRVEDANGCIEIAQAEVIQGGECFTSKELLSYNGNGKNTEFIIRCAEKFDNTLRIFNRWGQMVYETSNYDNTWSGIDQDGNDVPEGGYFYVFEYDDAGTTHRVRGSITILR